MATNFPTAVDDVSTVGDGTHPSADEALSSTDGGPAHHSLHQNVGLAINAIEDKVGTGASTPAANSVLAGTGSGTSAWTTGTIENSTNGNAATATTATNLSGGTVAATTLTASEDANFNSGTLFVDVSTNRVGIGDTTPGYKLDVTGEIRATSTIRGSQFLIGTTDDGIKTVTGDYGTVQTAGSGASGYEGYSIAGHAVFMSSSSSSQYGLYDDANSKWGISCDRLGGTKLYHNGTQKLITSSTGATVTGTLTADGFSGPLTGTASNATQLGGVAAANYLRSDTADTFNAALTVTGVLDANDVVKITDGTVGSPSLTFDADEDTGIHRNATNQFALVAGGVGGLIVAAGTVNTAGLETTTTTGYKYVVRNETYGTLYHFSSSGDLKENITNVTASDAGAWIDALQPVTFNERWLQEGTESDEDRAFREADIQVGFIAEDVLANSTTAQFAQVEDVDGTLKGVGWKWECVIAATVAELKSVRARLATLEGN